MSHLIPSQLIFIFLINFPESDFVVIHSFFLLVFLSLFVASMHRIYLAMSYIQHLVT